MIEVRDASRNYWQVTGQATTWDRPYFVNDPRAGTFLERMARNPFADAVEGREAVELRHEHDPSGPVYATTAAGSLRFEDMRDGLLLAAALSKADRATAAVVGEIRAGKKKGLSVGMTVREDEWGTAADGRTAGRSPTPG